MSVKYGNSYYAIQPTANDQIFFTEYCSLKYPVVKSILSDGSKTIAADMTKASYRRLYVKDLNHFFNYLLYVSPYITMSVGATESLSGISGTRRSYEAGEDDSYRGQEFLKFYNNIYPLESNKYSLLFFDIDYKDGMPEHFKFDTPNDVRAMLIQLLPFLEACGMLVKASSSAFVKNSETGEYRSSHHSWHVFIIVFGHTEETNKQLKEYICRRAFRDDVNQAYLTLSKSESVLLRFYLDLSVLSQERLIAIAQPYISYPFVKEDVKGVVYDGGILDLTKIDAEIEEDYREKLQIMKKEFFLEKGLISKATLSNPSANSKALLKLNSDAVIPVASDSSIVVDEPTQNNLIEIYRYLQSTKKINFKKLKKHFTKYVLKAYLEFLGFEIDPYTMKFKIRDENTPSAVIYDSLIIDFGAGIDSFEKGDIFTFLIKVYGLSFVEALKHIKASFGIEGIKLDSKTLGVLPDPKKFGELINQRNNIEKEKLCQYSKIQTLHNMECYKF